MLVTDITYISSHVFPADDGALLAKIHKVKILRNEKREGKNNKLLWNDALDYGEVKFT
jgi:hypothetical protein